MLVGHRGDLGGVGEQSGNELATGPRQLIFGTGLEESIVLALEQGDVGVHPVARVLGHRLGHE